MRATAVELVASEETPLDSLAVDATEEDETGPEVVAGSPPDVEEAGTAAEEAPAAGLKNATRINNQFRRTRRRGKFLDLSGKTRQTVIIPARTDTAAE